MIGRLSSVLSFSLARFLETPGTVIYGGWTRTSTCSAQPVAYAGRPDHLKDNRYAIYRRGVIRTAAAMAPAAGSAQGKQWQTSTRLRDQSGCDRGATAARYH